MTPSARTAGCILRHSSIAPRPYSAGGSPNVAVLRASTCPCWHSGGRCQRRRATPRQLGRLLLEVRRRTSRHASSASTRSGPSRSTRPRGDRRLSRVRSRAVVARSRAGWLGCPAHRNCDRGRAVTNLGSPHSRRYPPSRLEEPHADSPSLYFATKRTSDPTVGRCASRPGRCRSGVTSEPATNVSSGTDSTRSTRTAEAETGTQLPVRTQRSSRRETTSTPFAASPQAHPRLGLPSRNF